MDYTLPPKATSVVRGSLACLVCMKAISHGSLASNSNPGQSSPSFGIPTSLILSQHLTHKVFSGSFKHLCANSLTKALCLLPFRVLWDSITLLPCLWRFRSRTPDSQSPGSIQNQVPASPYDQPPAIILCVTEVPETSCHSLNHDGPQLLSQLVPGAHKDH